MGTLVDEVDTSRLMRQQLQEVLRAVDPEITPLVDLPALTGTELDQENALACYQHALRADYLHKCASAFNQHWLTPPTGQRRSLPGNETSYTYAYDRQHHPIPLLSRLDVEPAHDTHDRSAVLCSSGMAALHVVLQSIRHLFPGTLRLGAFASYFETHSLFRLLRHAFQAKIVTCAQDLYESIRLSKFDIIYLEPVTYDWLLNVVDPGAIIEAVEVARRPPLLVIDTTMCPCSTHAEALVRRCLGSAFPLVVSIRSGLKFDQQGIELSNLGVVESWALRNHGELRSLGKVLSSVTTLVGAGVGWREACTLAPQFVLHGPARDRLCHDIFASNRQLFDEISIGSGLFDRKTYPAKPWDAPFVLFALRKGDRTNYIRLARVIANVSRKRKLGLIMSGSFGYRTERFETIVPGEQRRVGEQPTGILKIACGVLQGARLAGIIQLLSELGRFSSIEDAEAVLDS
jgi:hypothetical protein